MIRPFRLLLSALCLMGAWAHAAIDFTPEEVAWIAGHPEIRVGIEPDYPPFDFVDDKGRASGFSTRLVELAAGRAGLRFAPVTGHSWDELLLLCKRGEVDVLPCTRMTADRRDYMVFVEPAYARHVMGVAARPAGHQTPTRKNLDSHVIAIVRGFAVNDRLRLDYPRAAYLETQTPAEAMRLVSLGKADAYVDGVSTLNYLLVDKGYLHLRVTDEFDWQESGYYVAVTKRSPLLASILAKAIADIPPDQLNELKARWFNPRHGLGAIFAAYAYPVAGVALTLFAGLSLLMAWNRRLSREITRRTAAEVTALDACARAEEATRLKSEFLANMSHEIRTPMNAILGYAQLMSRDPALPHVCRSQVETINRAGEHLLALINDILEMSKIEAGRITLNRTGFDLYALLDGIAELYGERAKSKGLSLSLDVSPGLPRLVWTDEVKLRQALSNLIGNAVKFTGRGGVTLSVGVVQSQVGMGSNSASADEPVLAFSVRDTGPGISSDDLGKLFRPFVQAAAGNKAGGTGLGLAISRQYARLLGGDISVESVPGRGSVFTLIVRVARAPSGAVTKQSAIPRVLRLSASQSSVRILVADDNAQNREMLGALLVPLGFEVRHAADGAEAIRLFHDWKPHGILMDMRMPVVDGYEACRRIKAAPAGAETYILALTASAFEENRAAVLASGADDFMRKPFNQDELLARLGARLHLDYICAASPAVAVSPGVSGASERQDDALRETIARMPVALASEFAGACRAADYERLLELCERVDRADASAAKAIRDMICSFEYERIAKLFAEAAR